MWAGQEGRVCVFVYVPMGVCVCLTVKVVGGFWAGCSV